MAQVEVTHVPEEQRFEAVTSEGVLGRVEYERDGDVVVLTHTVVEPAAEGRGIGSALVRAALDAIRDDGLTVVPQCPFIASWIARNSEYADLVAEGHGPR